MRARTKLLIRGEAIGHDDPDTCAVHPHVTLTKFCPACRGSQGGTTGGKSTSAAKRAASKRNAVKGGRPKKART